MEEKSELDLDEDAFLLGQKLYSEGRTEGKLTEEDFRSKMKRLYKAFINNQKNKE
ncbi:MAG: hypothetical protein UU24_C0005G0002 [Candidatus Nomurabacteria bacterium GW2011_GWA2_40_9]|uniref:SHOCT domain-containing protein n=1 Tax=Candidatus Nomurabacteria bacterium GW2011_GWA2_40_9 TaxID=1618734 RepID=A0A0G0TRI7_9BACT|nr:MAG: hypothetical protein UU24_C0005G0002 [Candidatus Nomurabacteria bacterium GW2011_GWA2_40_9]